MTAGTYVLLIVTPCNFALNHLFAFRFGMGLLGAPIATGASYWLAFLLLVLYSRFIEGSACWGGWSRSCFSNCGTFARLAFFGFVHAGSEWWAFEIVALVAGRFGATTLAAQSIIMTTDQITNTIPFGISVVTSARVGNMLGAREPGKAARTASVAIWLSIGVGTTLLAVLMVVKDSYPKRFTSDTAVIGLTAEVMPYVALFQIADGFNASCSGVLRGSGRQRIGALVNILAYYIGALPLGIALAFNSWGLSGLWVGQCLALYLTGGVEWVIVLLTNWDYQIDAAFARMDDGVVSV